MSAVPKAVASAIAPSTANSVPILKDAQLGPYRPMTGKAINPVVPRTQVEGEKDMRSQPGFGGYAGNGSTIEGGSKGAPTVPTDGFLFKKLPIDSHYLTEHEARNPYGKVNNPATRGKWQRLQNFLNHIALTTQEVDPNGFRNSPPQQRTSVMRNVLPPLGDGYSPETYTPRQMPQAANTYKYAPSTGTDQYGTGVLNSDTYGAGQTAGGIGGNNYTPTPGPPDTTSIAGSNGTSVMPTWG